jgi:hypothetical protein
VKLRPEELRGGTHGSPTIPLLFRGDPEVAPLGSRRAKPGSARKATFRLGSLETLEVNR